MRFLQCDEVGAQPYERADDVVHAIAVVGAVLQGSVGIANLPTADIPLHSVDSHGGGMVALGCRVV